MFILEGDSLAQGRSFVTRVRIPLGSHCFFIGKTILDKRFFAQNLGHDIEFRVPRHSERPTEATTKDFDKLILPLGYLALFSSRLIIESKAALVPRRFALDDVKFGAGISIA